MVGEGEVTSTPDLGILTRGKLERRDGAGLTGVAPIWNGEDGAPRGTISAATGRRSSSRGLVDMLRWVTFIWFCGGVIERLW
ncbi:hypothetical protein M6B38_122935 [Iris pallida]|uniref:Uncharacterized protein n=1 Tax=Iris pallida TaxID=29817 RepID=A0AAX6H3T2_IRIPA|nr:hypothetical protein M6B38_122935 [Iris pallida]